MPDYSQLLESKLSVFVDKHKMTAHSFYAALLEAQTQDNMAASIIQYLLGATEYRRFVDLLIDRKMFHFGPGSAHALAAAGVGNSGSGNVGGGVGGEGGVDAGSKESSRDGSGSARDGGAGAGASKSSADEADDSREQDDNRDNGAADFSRKVSEPNLGVDQRAGRKDGEHESESAPQRK
jgi:hypothetical protein